MRLNKIFGRFQSILFLSILRFIKAHYATTENCIACLKSRKNRIRILD